jgi:hypothetical protein
MLIAVTNAWSQQFCTVYIQNIACTLLLWRCDKATYCVCSAIVYKRMQAYVRRPCVMVRLVVQWLARVISNHETWVRFPAGLFFFCDKRFN